MKELLHKNSLISIWYEKDTKLLSNQWTTKTEYMTTEDFKREILNFAQLSLDLKAKYVLGNTQYFAFTIVPDVQKWHDEVIAPLYLKAQIKKIALVVSADLFAHVSITQTLEENNIDVIPTQYFEDVKGARIWLLKG